MNHLPVWSPPLIFLVSEPEPRAVSQPSCFSPASVCSTDWPLVSLPFPLRLSHTDNYSSEPTLIFLLWEQGSSFSQNKNTAALGIKCRHCGNPGQARRSLPDWIRSGENWGNDRQVVVEYNLICCRAIQSGYFKFCKDTSETQNYDSLN